MNKLKVYMELPNYFKYKQGKEVKAISEESYNKLDHRQKFTYCICGTINNTEVIEYNNLTGEYRIKKLETSHNRYKRLLPKVKSNFDPEDGYYIMRMFKDGYFAITNQENRSNLDKVEAVL